MNLRLTASSASLCLAALLCGCATPNNLERIATVQNRAEALYAYGGVARFPLSSEVAEVSIYAPVARKHEFQAVTTPDGKLIKPAVTEQTHSADAIANEQKAGSKAQESAAQTKEKPIEAQERAEVQKETVVATAQAATQVEKPHAAEVREQTIATDTRVSEQQPTFHKKVSKDHVSVGDKFAFTLDFQNSTSVDLASVQLTDPLDSRLKLFQSEISVKPNYQHHVSVGSGQIVIRFTSEIKRGKRVLVTVPVMFPASSAAAAQ
jgi:uncharacterized repeat protein (TIGR01451 family)